MVQNHMCSARVAVVWIQFQDPSQLCKIIYTRWVHHGEAVNVNVTDYVEAADHHLDLPDAQVEVEEEVVVAEPVSLTNIETMLRNARAFRELSPAEEKRWALM